MDFFRSIVLGIALIGLLLAFIGCDGSGGSAAGDHPAVGHWMGSLTLDDGRTVQSSLLVDHEAKPLRVALTFIIAGALYTDCREVTVADFALGFRFVSRLYDLEFHGTVSADGRELAGEFAAPEGAKSNVRRGSFEYVKTPRAPDLPGVMRFARTMSDQTGAYTLSILLAETDDGRWVAQYSVPERSLNDLPLWDVIEEDGVITGSIKLFGPAQVFEMSLDEDRQRLTGSWSAGGTSTELDLPRVE